MARATWNGEIIAEAHRFEMVGGRVYFPPSSVKREFLVASDTKTLCPWKGRASYWRLAEGGEPIAWAYADPRPEVIQIRDHIAFYQNKVTVAVGTASYLAAAAKT